MSNEKKNDGKLLDFKDWKVHLLCLIMVVIADGIGSIPVGAGIIKFTLLPMLYALVIGIILAAAKVIKRDMMEMASPYIGISVMFLTVRMSSTIGPNLKEVLRAGLPLLLQELGNLGTLFFALPVGVLVFKMGREAVGCAFSTSREGALAIVGDIYGLDSPEGRGVMGAYITGTLLGAIFNSILASILCATGIFHPYALGMAAGTGSASMMAAALGPVVEAFPDMAEQISAYAATSQVLTGVDGMYMSLFVALPLTNFLYRKLKKEKKGADKAIDYQKVMNDAENAEDE